MTEKRYELTYFDCFYITDHLTNDSKYGKDYATVSEEDLEKVVEILNEQDQQIKELEQKLFTEKVKRFEDNLAEYGDLNDKEAWQRKFGMSRREANKKAGIIDWELIPED